jgi:hypothetical protein
VIRVTIDLLPGGDPARAKTLRTVEIVNERFICGTVYEYSAVMTEHHEGGGVSQKVGAFIHNRNSGIEACVEKALEAVGR